jgi:hypothetical protein
VVGIALNETVMRIRAHEVGVQIYHAETYKLPCGRSRFDRRGGGPYGDPLTSAEKWTELTFRRKDKGLRAAGIQTPCACTRMSGSRRNATIDSGPGFAADKQTMRCHRLVDLDRDMV